MNRNMMNALSRWKLAALLAASVFFYGCAASGPATRFYSLFPQQSEEVYTPEAAELSVGVGPVTLPEYLENPAIASLTDGQRIVVSGYHAWAGGIKDAVTRVLADNLAYAYPGAHVEAFPWDNRIRPAYQLRIEFKEFSGQRGGVVRSSLAWSLLNKKADAVVANGVSTHEMETVSAEVEDYVAALNTLLNRNTEELAKELSQVFK